MNTLSICIIQRNLINNLLFVRDLDETRRDGTNEPTNNGRCGEYLMKIAIVYTKVFAQNANQIKLLY